MEIVNLIHRRLPNKVTRVPTMVIHQDKQTVVMCILLNPSKPLIIEESVLLDKNFIGVWYCTYRDWHDVGAVYDCEKNFKGYYCDLCSPIEKVPDGYEITDYFLDLWLFPDGRYLVLDQDEFSNAIGKGWMSQKQIAQTKEELDDLIESVESKEYPSSRMKELIRLPENIDEIILTLEQITSTREYG